MTFISQVRAYMYHIGYCSEIIQQVLLITVCGSKNTDRSKKRQNDWQTVTMWLTTQPYEQLYNDNKITQTGVVKPSKVW